MKKTRRSGACVGGFSPVAPGSYCRAPRHTRHQCQHSAYTHRCQATWATPSHGPPKCSSRGSDLVPISPGRAAFRSASNIVPGKQGHARARNITPRPGQCAPARNTEPAQSAVRQGKQRLAQATTLSSASTSTAGSSDPTCLRERLRQTSLPVSRCSCVTSTNRTSCNRQLVFKFTGVVV